MRDEPDILFAGQICGGEGYIEAIATGYMAGVHASELAHGRTPQPPPITTAMGGLANYIANADASTFQPMNITFALLPPLNGAEHRRFRKKIDRRRRQVEIALQDFEGWRFRYLRRAVSYELYQNA
jgi:methylenetetrahydrofolate--tRNA-(uracil-5-)-methyltransferase